MQLPRQRVAYRTDNTFRGYQMVVDVVRHAICLSNSDAQIDPITAASDPPLVSEPRFNSVKGVEMRSYQGICFCLV
jgi:hypothetical protein